MEFIINLSYIVASVLFIIGIKMLGSADTARKGNLISAAGMLLAIVVTLLDSGLDYTWIIAGLLIGGAIGAVWAKRVQMTGMPELVALLNGFGGLGSLLVGWAEFARERDFASSDYPLFTAFAVIFAILVGGITFTGSLVAYLKLSGKMSGSAMTFPYQKAINAAVFLVLIIVGGIFVVTHASWALYLIILLSLALGVLGVIPIGGGDMPVVISFLNSCSSSSCSLLFVSSSSLRSCPSVMSASRCSGVIEAIVARTFSSVSSTSAPTKRCRAAKNLASLSATVCLLSAVSMTLPSGAAFFAASGAGAVAFFTLPLLPMVIRAVSVGGRLSSEAR